MAYPTGTFTGCNVPVGTVDNMTAGQGVVIMDLRAESSPEGLPSTQAGWCKEVKITKEGVPLIFKQGMPLEEINRILMETNIMLHFKGFEWNMDLFQMQEGNTAVDKTDPTKEVWGIGGEATIRAVKALVFHKLLDGRYIWINCWKLKGDGNFGIDFNDADWFSHDYAFAFLKASEDFEGNALTSHYLCRFEETNLPTA